MDLARKPVFRSLDCLRVANDSGTISDGGATSSLDVVCRPEMTALSGDPAAVAGEHLAVGVQLYHVKPASVIVCDTR